MSVSEIGSAQSSQSAYAAQKSEQAEAKGPGGRDVKNDHDGDDRAAAAAAGPSVNLNGQVTGAVISKSA